MMQTYVKLHRMIAGLRRPATASPPRYRVVGALEKHDLIAHGLHDAPAVLRGDSAHQRQARVDDHACAAVPKRIVKLGAFAYVGEQYG
jgi:hypothetical protein